MINPWVIIAIAVFGSSMFAGGMATHSKFIAAGQLKEANKQLADYKEKMRQQSEADLAVVTNLRNKLKEAQANVRIIREEVPVYINNTPQCEPVIGLVELYNQTVRSEFLPDAPGLSPEYSQLPSGVTNTEFTRACFGAIEAFNEVRVEKNALVDWLKANRTQAD